MYNGIQKSSDFALICSYISKTLEATPTGTHTRPFNC